MANLYKNDFKMNYGLSPVGQNPVDDRLVIESIEDIFINTETYKSSPLYNRAYKGMMVSTFDANDGSGAVLVLSDATPYTPGMVTEVNADNYTDFWSYYGNNIYDEIDTAKNELNEHIDSSVNELTEYVNTEFDATKKDFNLHLDSSVAQLNKNINDATYYYAQGNSKTLKTLTSHGNLPAGLTVEQLESMTISKILTSILFEIATPVKTKSMSVSASFKSPYNSVLEVGSEYPTSNSFNYSFTSEAWNWTSSNDANVKGEEKNLSKFDSVTYYYNTTNNTNGGVIMTQTPSGYTNNKIINGTNGYFYASIDYVDNEYAVDSLNNNAHEGSTEYYAAPKHGTIKSSILTITGAYNMFSNAPKCYDSLTTAWNDKNNQPTGFNQNTKNAAGLCSASSVTKYFKWPSGTSDDILFHIYVPVAYSVSSCKVAEDGTPAYKTSVSCTQQSGTVKIASTVNNSILGEYKDYVIAKSAGITSIEIVIKK